MRVRTCSFSPSLTLSVSKACTHIGVRTTRVIRVQEKEGTNPDEGGKTQLRTGKEQADRGNENGGTNFAHTDRNERERELAVNQKGTADGGMNEWMERGIGGVKTTRKGGEGEKRRIITKDQGEEEWG